MTITTNTTLNEQARTLHKPITQLSDDELLTIFAQLPRDEQQSVLKTAKRFVINSLDQNQITILEAAHLDPDNRFKWNELIVKQDVKIKSPLPANPSNELEDAVKHLDQHIENILPAALRATLKNKQKRTKN